jgi:hypothetical protein
MNALHLSLVTVMAVASCGGSVMDEGAGGATGAGASTTGTGASTTGGAGAGASTTSTGTSTTTGAGGGGWVDRTQGTNAAQQLWTAVASDASGDNLVATSTIVIPPGHFIGGVWTSTNAGLTWTVSSAGPVGLGSVASNSAGTVLAAVEGMSVGDGEIWTSPSSGAAWTGSTPSHNGWGSVASDATGTHLVAVAAFGDVWTSTDSGATWTDRTPAGSAHGQNWVSVASDASGAHLVAVAGGGFDVAGPGSSGDIWTSADAGMTWTDQTPSGPAHDLSWASVASDGAGTHLIAVGAGIWTSRDAGVTWTEQSAPPSMSAWVSVASDSTGTHLVAANGGVGATGDIWTSVDSGVTWTNQTAGTSAAEQAWSAVASDGAGAHLVGVVRDGDIWTN